MSRVQLALNVNDIDEAVSFYTKLFGTEPAKRRPGYANNHQRVTAPDLVLQSNRPDDIIRVGFETDPGSASRLISLRRMLGPVNSTFLNCAGTRTLNSCTPWFTRL